MSWFSKHIEVTFKLDNEPNNVKFSPVRPVVKGRLSIAFSEEVGKICGFRCGLKGIANMVYHVMEVQRGPLQGPPYRRRLITDRRRFFEVFKDLPLDSDKFDEKQTSALGMRAFTYNEGDKYTADFELEFPDTVYLPSSYRQFGTPSRNVSIAYELYVEIYKVGGMFTKKPKVYSTKSIPIRYQSGKDPNLIKSSQSLTYNENSLFENKVKKFYFDKESNALIPTSLHNNHTKTKFIRKLWNDDYKDENYSQMTKSIPLDLEFSTKSSLDLAAPFGSQIYLNLISNLRLAGLESNQTTDFVYNGQSTHLGVFQIEYLLIEAIYHTRVECRQYIMKGDQDVELSVIEFENLIFDVKDFEYDKQNDSYRREIPLHALAAAANVDLHQSLMDILNDKTIVCTGTIPNWFESSVTLRFTWKITDGMAQKKKIVFETESSPDFLVGIVRRGGGNTDGGDDMDMPPPTYETSGNDEKIDYEKVG